MSGKHKSGFSRREFVKGIGKVAYVAPVILTLQAMPSFASAGSSWESKKDCRRLRGDEKKECKDYFKK